MISLHNIASVAKYERKTLLRSWFFRIFAILAILILTGYNLGNLIFDKGGAGNWQAKAISSVIPYANLLLLNIVQAIIAIFLASDFLKRDKKLDTTEVIYMRPMTNGEYVLGKTIGNFGVFVVLNLLILAIAMVINLVAKNTDVNYQAYLYYFLLISVPTLIYIMGLSFFVMSVLKNQAITFVVMLGYVAISLFYLQDTYYYLFDYMAFNIPLTYSDFVGFGHLKTILVHRGMYFFFGTGMIFFTVLLLKRLSHSEAVRYFSIAFGTASILFGLFLGYTHVNRFQNDQELRAEMIALNDEWAEQPVLTVTDYDLQVEHQRHQIAVIAKLKVSNRNRQPLEKVLFSLNPGLTPTRILRDGQLISFEVKPGLVIFPDFKIDSYADTELEFEYSGNINEAAAYLDIDDETRRKAFSVFMYKVDKRHAFITPDYVLLTRENAWYPVPGTGIGTKSTQWFDRQFSHYKLQVKTADGLTAISQGKAEQEGSTFRFESSNANSQISLIIGDYEQIQQEIDGLEFNIFIKKGHDYFSEFFEDIKDTIPSIVTESLQDLERNLDLYYPFERFSIVEVPIQFTSYEHVLSGSREQIQPEMILFSEKGLLVDAADFNGRFEQPMRFGPRNRDQDLTPEERKIQVLQNFINSFTEEQGRPDFSRTAGEMNVTETKNTYYVFPLFYNYAYYIGSPQWPITDRVFEGYKKSSLSSSGAPFWMRNMQGVSSNEEANIALLSNSFEELLQDPDKRDIIDNVIQLKSTSLFSIIKRKVGDEAFEDFLFNYFKRIKFKNASIEDFNRAIKREFDIDLIPYMESWFSSKKLPAFLIGNVSVVNVLDLDELKTMVKFKVSNTEDAEGIISVEFRTGGGRGGFGGSSSSDNITKLVHLNGNETKEVSFLLSGSPRGGNINTLVSRNMPSEIQLQFNNVQEDLKAIPFEGEIVVDDPVRVAEANEIIVDNEDPGFSYSKNEERSLLRRWLFKDKSKEEEYSGFDNWRPPLNWRQTTNSAFYGAYVRSAYYIRSGDGDQKASWKLAIPEAGYYDVYAYIYKPGRGPGRDRNPGEYHFTIHNDEGAETTSLDVRSAEDGWNHLGGFYFSADSALVELTNENEGRVVVADAIKFILR